MTQNPTPLEDFEEAMDGFSGEQIDRLRAFLSRPAVQALADPATGAAAAVIVQRLPELLEMEAKATPGPWNPNVVPETEDYGSWGAGPLCTAEHPEEIDCEEDQIALAQSDADFIAATRNAIHEAAKAAKEAPDAHP